jgi:hypothetical protein
MEIEKQNKDNKLNEKQLLFCKYFVSEDFFCNGTKAYAKAYNKDLSDIKQYNVCKVSASELLTNPNISLRIQEEVKEAGLNDNFADKQLYLSMLQNVDFSSKVKAISEYNKLRQRIVTKVESKNENINLNTTVEIIKSDSPLSSNEKDISLD